MLAQWDTAFPFTVSTSNFTPCLNFISVSKTLLITAKMIATVSSINVLSLIAVLNLYCTFHFRASDNTVTWSVTSFKFKINVSQYFNEAIDLLSTVINKIYVDCDNTNHCIQQIQSDLIIFEFKIDLEFQYVHKWFKKVNECLDNVDKHLNKVNRHLKDLNEHLINMNCHLINMNCHLKIMKNNINKQFKYNLAFQRNQLIHMLKTQIEWIAELKVNEMSMKRNEIINAFFMTV